MQQEKKVFPQNARHVMKTTGRTSTWATHSGSNGNMMMMMMRTMKVEKKPPRMLCVCVCIFQVFAMISLPGISTVSVATPLSRVADGGHGGVPVTGYHDSIDGLAVRAQAFAIAERGSIHVVSVDAVPLEWIL